MKFTARATAFAILLCLLTSVGVTHAADNIRVGALASISGPMSLPESTAAAKAVFDRVNAHGGIQGRQIEYLVQDDKGDAGSTAQAARSLVDSQGVVVFAGSSSLQDCSVNANFYRQRGILSIPGVGGEFSCYQSKTFAPVSVGPARGTLATLNYATTKVGSNKLCVFLIDIPAHGAGNKWAVENYPRMFGKKLHLVDMTVLPNDDMTPHVLKAKNAQCDTVVFSGSEQMDLAWVKAMQMQGTLKNTKLVLMAPAYTTNFAKIVGIAGDGIYVNSEYEPFLSDSPALKDWRELMAANKIAESAFAQGGYLSAIILVDALKRISGPITRESITAELRRTTGDKAIQTAMLGQPFDFSAQADHLSVSATKFVQIKNGQWQVLTPDFFVTKAVAQ